MKIELLKDKCTGCHACANMCVKQCIEMKPDKYGFLRPHINHEECINCGACDKACPVFNDRKLNDKGVAYGCINTNNEERGKSSSGGIFSIIAKKVLKDGGVVFGAGYDEKFVVRHLAIIDETQLGLLRGSKYVQSCIGDTYKKAKEYLENGRIVLFSGTPCQIGGLYSYLKKDYDNLITQDIICHGVPTPEIWKKYLQYLCKTYGSEISKTPFPNFRDKSKGWLNFGMSVHLENGIHIQEHRNNNMYMKAFLKNWCLRETCYACRYKTVERESDITLADFWGVTHVMPQMTEETGTSLVLINSAKGQRIFDEIQKEMKVLQVDTDIAVSHNSAAWKSVDKPVKREEFLQEISSENFPEMIKKYIKEKRIRLFFE